jgi:membrane protease YdiL (CAAX protease family)
MEPYPEAGPVEPQPVKPCRACNLPIKPTARYCPNCGAYQYPTQELERRMSRIQQNWPSVRNAIIFFLVYLCSVVPLLWLPEDQAANGMLIISVVDAVIILVFWAVSGIPAGEILRVSRSTPRFSAVALFILVPMLAVNLGYHHLLETAFGTGPILISEAYTRAGYSGWVAILDLCVMPAIFEEIAFRGLIQGSLGRVLKTREAIILTAILFAIIHFSVLSGPYLLGLGLVLGLLRERSQSLVPGMTMHFFHNLVVVLLEWYENPIG